MKRYFEQKLITDSVRDVSETSRKVKVAISQMGSKDYDNDVIDPNGERVEWLEGTIAEPYLVTKFHSDGKERLKDAFQSGQLEFKKIWELEG